MIGPALKRWRRPSWAAYKFQLQHSKRPILIGPWRSELGFEALYWMPFLQALNLDPSRCFVIGRGGSASLYTGMQPLELYDLREPTDVRIENILQFQRTATLKQFSLTPWDRAVLKDAAAKAGLRKYHVLHPAWMYHLLMPFWEGKYGVEWIWPHLLKKSYVNKQKQLALDPIVAPVLEPLNVPTPFVAARFYFRSTFPAGDSTMTIAKEVLKRCAQQWPVVLLNSGIHADEHMDYDPKDLPNVYRLTELTTLTPQNNLAVQAAVLQQSQGFVGTYGGLSQLALRMAKPSISLYLEWKGTALAHKHLADAMSTAMKVPCWVVKMQDVPLLKTVMPDFTVG